MNRMGFSIFMQAFERHLLYKLCLKYFIVFLRLRFYHLAISVVLTFTLTWSEMVVVMAKKFLFSDDEALGTLDRKRVWVPQPILNIGYQWKRRLVLVFWMDSSDFV